MATELDYWKGGWANSPMRSLPGTQAAAMNKGRYGPWNALADIIGAVWQRNARRGANKAADAFGADLDSIETVQEGAPSRDMQLGKTTGDQGQLNDLQQEQYAPRKLSFNDYRTMVNDRKGKLMRDLVRKYGMENAQMVADSITDAANQRLSRYGDSVLADTQNELDAYMRQNPLTQQNFGDWYSRIRQANMLSNSMGRGDLYNLQDFVNNAKTKLTTLNTGGKTDILASTGSGLALGRDAEGNPVYYTNAGEIQNTLSPKDKITAQQKAQELVLQARDIEEKIRHNRATEEDLRNYRQMEIELRRMGIDIKSSGGNGQGAARGVSAQEVSAAKAILENPDATPEEQAQAKNFLQRAIGGGQQGGGGAEFQFTGNWNNDAPMIREMARRAEARGNSPEQIAKGIYDYCIRQGLEEEMARAYANSVTP